MNSRSRIWTRRGLTAVMACATLLLTSCLHTGTVPSSALGDIVKFEAGLNAVVTTAFTDVSTAAAAGLISQQTANVISQALLQIEQANMQAQTLTASITTLSAANKATLLNLLGPITTTISNLVANGTVGIKDPTTQQKVQLDIVAISTAIAAGVALITAVVTAS